MVDEWYTYSDSAMSVWLPRTVKKTRGSGSLFKGRIHRAGDTTQLCVAIQIDLTSGEVEAITRAALDRKPPVDWMGARWTYRYLGVSREREGGIEVQITQHGPPTGHESHCWQSLFAESGRFVLVDVFSSMGKLSWREFAAVGSAIIASVQLMPSQKSGYDDNRAV